MSPVNVLIVDDSPFIRKTLCRIIESDADLNVADVASNGKEAVEKVMTSNPDVITMDIMMPEMNGIEALKIIMEKKPTPVLMLSQYTRDGTELTLNALELGAMDFIDKSSTGIMDFFRLSNEIITKIKSIAGNKPLKLKAPLSSIQKCRGEERVDVVTIGTSTGGPSALQMVLPTFPKDIGFGVLVVQHMPHGFTGPLAKRLDSICDIEVKEAEDGDLVEPGVALVAPSGLHMTVKKLRNEGVRIRCRVKIDVEPMDVIHKPSVDVLLFSVVRYYGKRALAVIMTGMGADGAQGMKALREKGGMTLAQDRGTSTIFGMPKSAIEKGGIEKVVPITSMGEEIIKCVYNGQ
jgi:two-component system chemotaxis response regulator CheB